MNTAIADYSSGTKIINNPAEEAMGREVSAIEAKAMALVVADNAGYAAAGEYLKDIKRMQKQVKEYWEPLRVSTKKAYDDVIGKRKEMVVPLDGAEKILKGKMGDYASRLEEERRKREAAMKRLAQQEMERKFAEAAEAEAAGDVSAAEYAMAEAEVMEGVSISGSAGVASPKVEGVSRRKTWEIINIDSADVPVNFNGMELRPVDEKAVMALIKASKGKIQIPGIQYKETYTISARG